MQLTPREWQSAEYAFPYHHLPHLDERGMPHVGRSMRAGMEYLAYTLKVVDVVRELQPSSALDVGCGDGRLLTELQLTDSEIWGVDLDARAIGHARAFAPDVVLAVRAVDLLERPFDVVTCVETLEHIADDAVGPFLMALGERVATGGHLVLTVPSTARAVHEKHYRHYDIETVKHVVHSLPGDWTITRLDEIVAHRPWLERALRALGNRFWTLDLPAVNRRILALHNQPVPRGRRGLHVLVVAQRRA